MYALSDGFLLLLTFIFVSVVFHCKRVNKKDDTLCYHRGIY